MAMFDETMLTTAIERSLSTYLLMGRRAVADSERLVAALEDHLRGLMTAGLDNPRRLHVAGVKHLVVLNERLSLPGRPRTPGRKGSSARRRPREALPEAG